MTDRLFPPTIEEQCQSAMDRIFHYVNRAAGQHLHHIRSGFAEALARLGVV